MKKGFLRIASVILVLIMALSVVACSAEAKVKKYVEKHGDELVSEVKKSTGGQAECEVSAEGTEIHIDVKIKDVNDLNDAAKNQIKATLENQKADFKEMMSDAKDEVKGLTGVVFKFCEEDGDEIVSLNIELD